MKPHGETRVKPIKVLAWLGAGAALLAVFAAYLRPEVVLTLATQVWSCF